MFYTHNGIDIYCPGRTEADIPSTWDPEWIQYGGTVHWNTEMPE